MAIETEEKALSLVERLWGRGRMTMNCTSCGMQNPPNASFCLRCGNRLAMQEANAQGPQLTRAGHYAANQAKSMTDKMLETPGTILLAVGVFFLLIAILLMAIDRWGSGIGVFAVSMILLFVAVKVRESEAKSASAQAAYAPRIYQSTEIKEREIVKVKCRYCGCLNPDGARNCISCGALI